MSEKRPPYPDKTSTPNRPSAPSSPKPGGGPGSEERNKGIGRPPTPKK